MGRHAKISAKGIGFCGSPGCDKRKAEGHFLCADHVADIAYIKEWFDALYRRESIYNQRSDNSDRVIREITTSDIKAPSRPTCCALDCFEERIPPSNFCIDHEYMEALSE